VSARRATLALLLLLIPQPLKGVVAVVFAEQPAITLLTALSQQTLLVGAFSLAQHPV